LGGDRWQGSLTPGQSCTIAFELRRRIDAIEIADASGEIGSKAFCNEAQPLIDLLLIFCAASSSSPPIAA
jgi:hypothetical protein